MSVLTDRVVLAGVGHARIGMPVRVVFSDLDLEGDDVTLACFEADERP